MANSLLAGWLVSIIAFGIQGATGTQSHGLALQVSAPFDAPPKLPPARERHSYEGPAIALSSAYSQQVVRAALHASGIPSDSEALDGIASRSRTAALLPETRVHVARSDDASASVSSTGAALDNERFAGASKWSWEGRLTWKLDRIVYSGEEPALERIRLDQAEARVRVAHRALEALFAWERARIDALPGDSTEAALRLRETECTLDVLTGGWFTRSQPRGQHGK
jgi:hypothetical protein